MPKLIPHHINGAQVETQGRRGAVYNPATGEQSGSVCLASTADVNAAISVAKKAFPAWGMTAPRLDPLAASALDRLIAERSPCLESWRQAMSAALVA